MTDRTCAVPECDSPSRARDLCNKHYKRLRRTGTTDDPSVEARFFSHVTENADGCWIFDSLDGKGYGQISVDGQNVHAYVWAYLFLIGDIPEGLTLDHLCRVRACVNPWHLDPVPHRVNILRGIGPAAVNARRTQCVNGHPFTRANTYVTPDGRRQCRTCQRTRTDEFRHRS